MPSSPALRELWQRAGLRLEPSAAAAFVGVAPYLMASPEARGGTHVVWTTGGALLPEAEFRAALGTL